MTVDSAGLRVALDNLIQFCHNNSFAIRKYVLKDFEVNLLFKMFFKKNKKKQALSNVKKKK